MQRTLAKAASDPPREWDLQARILFQEVPRSHMSRIPSEVTHAAAQRWRAGKGDTAIVRAARVIDHSREMGMDVRNSLCLSLALSAMVRPDVSQLANVNLDVTRMLFSSLYDAYQMRLPIFRPADWLSRDYLARTNMTVGDLEEIVDRYLPPPRYSVGSDEN